MILTRRTSAVADAECVVEHLIRIVGLRNVLEDVGGDRIDSLGADDVQHTAALQPRALIRVGDDVPIGVEGVIERNDTGGVRIAAEVAGAELRDRQRDQTGVRQILCARSFGREKEEGFVAAVEHFRDPGRTADGGGFEVLAMHSVRRVGIKESLRIQIFIANSGERRAVKCVGAGLGGVVENAVRRAAEFSRIAAGLHFELFDAFRADDAHCRIVAALAHRLAAIEQHAIAECLPPCDSRSAARGVGIAGNARVRAGSE